MSYRFNIHGKRFNTTGKTINNALYGGSEDGIILRSNIDKLMLKYGIVFKPIPLPGYSGQISISYKTLDTSALTFIGENTTFLKIPSIYFHSHVIAVEPFDIQVNIINMAGVVFQLPPSQKKLYTTVIINFKNYSHLLSFLQTIPPPVSELSSDAARMPPTSDTGSSHASPPPHPDSASMQSLDASNGKSSPPTDYNTGLKSDASKVLDASDWETLLSMKEEPIDNLIEFLISKK